MKDKSISRILVFFALISVIMLGVAVQSVRTINRSVTTSDWVNHTHAVIMETDAVLGALRASDGALRTFAMLGDARDRVDCREYLTDAAEHMEVSRALTRRESTQEQFDQLAALVERRIAFTKKALAAGKSGDKETVTAILTADAGAEDLREIQRRVEKLKSGQMELLASRDQEAYRQAQTTRWTVWAGAAIEVVLLIGVAWVIRDDLASRRRLAATLQTAKEQLETRVHERTAELAAANKQLAFENMERRWSIQSLEHQLRYNQLIISSISDLVIVLTKALNISRINPAVAHLTGFESADLVNQPLSRVVRLATSAGAAESPMFDPLLQALSDGRDLRDQPALAVDKRGRRIPVRLTLFPLRDKDKVVGGIAVIQAVPATDGPTA